MNIKQYLESKLSEIYYSNTDDDYDEYLNYENDAEEILKSILKAIMEETKKLESKYNKSMCEGWCEIHELGACSCGIKHGVESENWTVNKIESVIKDLLQK